MLTLTSPAFSEGENLPARCSYEKENRSPELHWSNPPPAVREYALIVEDPDAPQDEPWVHWVIYKIPADARMLPAGLAPRKQATQPAGAIQGMNSWGEIGWGGPLPPPGHGRHRYYFHLYALSKKVNLDAGATKEELLQAMEGNIIAEAVLMGCYERKRIGREAA